MPLPPLLLERLKRRKIIQDLKADNRSEEARTKATTNNIEHATASVVSGYENSPPSLRRDDDLIPSQEEEDHEEIIAEDYSDEDDEGGNNIVREVAGEVSEASQGDNLHSRQISEIGKGEKTSEQQQQQQQVESNCLEILSESVIGCPNKYNIYHDCSKYCVENYGQPESVSPTLEQRKQLALILRTYPMSNEWTVVYDPGVKTFYFWNIISNLVSWFPPGMDGFLSLSADNIRKTMKEMETHEGNGKS